MFFSKKPKKSGLTAVCDGRCQPISDIPDEAFASEMLGNGIAIEPSGKMFYSPVDGKIENVAATGHAYSISTDDGLDILVHIGVDTVTLGGEGFSPAVSAGQRVSAGDRLAEVDIDLIKTRGYSAITAVLVTTPERITDIEYKYGTTVGGKSTVMTFGIS
ncbi:MAG: PTS glucose transporter subunit IIA [Eubacteriales bacterium]